MPEYTDGGFVANPRDHTPWVDILLPSQEGKLTLRLPELNSDTDRRIVYSEDNLKELTWQRRSAGALSTSWQCKGLAAFRLDLTPEADGLSIDWTITNQEIHGWPSASGVVCMQSHALPAIHDPSGERTYFRVDHRWINVESTWKGVGSTWYLPPGQEPLNIMVPHIHNGSWKVSDIHPDEAIMAVVSRDRQWILAQAWHRARYLIANIHDGYACTDVGSGFGDIAAGEHFQVLGKIYFLRGNLDDLEMAYRGDLGRQDITFRSL